MNFHSLANFVYVPDSTSSVNGTLHELLPSETFSENSFIVVPYQNPQVKKISPRFFKIKNRLKIKGTFPSGKIENSFIQLTSKTSKKDYIKKVTELKQHIQQGNIYEINYCIQFYAENVDLDPLTIFEKLHLLAKAPYSMLVKMGNDFIISASPELFLKKEGNLILTKPIKGTTKRGKNSEEDDQLKYNLEHSLKERTENVMAVDVSRNDLSVFAERGSVKVNKLYNIETFETVHQMVSTVSCEIRNNVTFSNILDATFPMASMTGAPKLRAMQLIDKFEDFERNYYSGTMGLVNEKGDFILSVLIRSIFYNQQTKKLSFSVGGAITYLCDPEQEYEECLLKASALIKVLNATITDVS
jgi:para-aminobenzoate synthetase component 1